jgi:hypothetical protein
VDEVAYAKLMPCLKEKTEDRGATYKAAIRAYKAAITLTKPAI